MINQEQVKPDLSQFQFELMNSIQSNDISGLIKLIFKQARQSEQYNQIMNTPKREPFFDVNEDQYMKYVDLILEQNNMRTH
jgi:hypothetical protein